MNVDELKLGRLKPSPAHLAMAPRLSNYMRRELPLAPLALDYTPGVEYMLGRNDEIGDCTIVALANYFATAAKREGRSAGFTDAEIGDFYFDMTGGPDVGLVEVAVLERAQLRGFPAGGEHKLAAWVRIDSTDLDTLRSCASCFWGLYVGVGLPLRAQSTVGALWDATGATSGDDAPDSWGGHAMFLAKYDANGPTFITWAQQQRATWAWWRTYVQEVYALLDAERALLAGVDFDALRADLWAAAQR